MSHKCRPENKIRLTNIVLAVICITAYGGGFLQYLHNVRCHSDNACGIAELQKDITPHEGSTPIREPGGSTEHCPVCQTFKANKIADITIHPPLFIHQLCINELCPSKEIVFALEDPDPSCVRAPPVHVFL